jgi:hypothetical protein
MNPQVMLARLPALSAGTHLFVRGPVDLLDVAADLRLVHLLTKMGVLRGRLANGGSTILRHKLWFPLI